MPVPIEFVVQGKPASVNAETPKKKAWQSNVEHEAGHALACKFFTQPAPPPYGGKMTVKLFFFVSTGQYIDVDNGIKYTIDAMARSIIENDKTVHRVIAERIHCKPGVSVITPAKFAPTLCQAFNIVSASKDSATAIKVEAYEENDGAIW